MNTYNPAWNETLVTMSTSAILAGFSVGIGDEDFLDDDYLGGFNLEPEENELASGTTQTYISEGGDIKSFSLRYVGL